MSGLPKPKEGWALGVDVSRFQGRIDAEALVEHGVEFLYARASDGLRDVDPQWAATAAVCAASGLPCGPYGVIEPYSSMYARDQAQHFVDVVGDAPWTLPPALDFELARHLPASAALLGARRWLDTVEDKLGRGCIVYTGPSFFNELAKLSSWVPTAAADIAAIAKRPLWVAHYGVARPRCPRAWDDWTIWQASGNGAATLPHTAVAVDVDWYRGDVDELLELGRRPQASLVAQASG